MSIQVQLLPHQKKTLQSPKKAIALTSGVGGGKTWTGVHWVIQKSVTHKKSLGFIGANTYSQLKNSTLAAVFDELMRLSIEFSYNQSSGILEINGKKWLCKSMDNFNVLRGIEVGEIWLDECAYMKEEAYDVIKGRLRDKNGSLTMLLTSTPKGYNWFYHHFHPDGDKYNSKSNILIKATSHDNIFLPDGYLDDLSEQYDEKLLAQELGGEFLNVSSGLIYYAFSEDNNVKKLQKHPNYPIYVGMDFNPHRMAAVIGQVVGNSLFIFDEIFDTSPGANTEKVCKEIIMRYGNPSTITIVPDSTGKKATSNANRSDIQIIKDMGFKLKVASNPFRVDRYAAVNGTLSKQRLTLDSGCKNIIKGLKSDSYKQDSDKPDTTDPQAGHMTDALGYLVYRTINPLTGNRQQISTYKR